MVILDTQLPPEPVKKAYSSPKDPSPTECGPLLGSPIEEAIEPFDEAFLDIFRPQRLKLA